jgi:hypothetical protein
MLGVSAIVLDFVTGRARDLRRRRDHTLDPTLGQLARERVSGRASLIGNPDRPRQPRAKPSRVRVLAVHHKHLKLARVAVQDRRDDLRRVHVRTDRDLAFTMAGSSYAVLDAARGATRTAQNPHERIAGNRPISSTQAGRQRPYGLCRSTIVLATARARFRRDPSTIIAASHGNLRAAHGRTCWLCYPRIWGTAGPCAERLVLRSKEVPAPGHRSYRARGSRCCRYRQSTQSRSPCLLR